MDPQRVEASKRATIQLIETSLANAEVLGLPGGIEAHRIVAAAAIAATGGTDGCPVWDRTRLGQIPELDSNAAVTGQPAPSAWPTKTPGAWALPSLPLPKEEWRDPLAKVAGVVESTNKAVSELNGAMTAVFDELLRATRQRVGALENQAWETNAIWWSHALYSMAREASYRLLPENERLLWMAEDLAAVGPAKSHRGLEAFFVETLHRSNLGFDISAVKPAEEWLATVQEAARAGRLAVIVPDARVQELAEAVARAAPGLSFGGNPDLTSEIVLLGARQAKGLEFDSVLIADPAAILAASPRGRNDLYVAMTRSTQRLGVLHPGPPPAEIAALRATATGFRLR